jgi:cation diffusion facilitator CzcD-associated flavoprotein CzcO
VAAKHALEAGFHVLHPAAEQIHAYLDAYARALGVVEHIRFNAPVEEVVRRARPSAPSASTSRPQARAIPRAAAAAR